MKEKLRERKNKKKHKRKKEEREKKKRKEMQRNDLVAQENCLPDEMFHEIFA